MSKTLYRQTLCFLLGAALMGLTVIPAMAEQYQLSYSNFFPPTHIQSKLAQSWCDEVEKATNGQVKIDYYPGGTLTNARQCYDGVVDGISDMGMSALGYTRGRFPLMSALDLPLGYESGEQATKAAQELYSKFKPKEFKDVEIMFFHAHGPGLLFTNQKAVRKLEDMKGLKLRATGNSAKVVKALGGTPVAMSMPDSYQSIQKGIVDGGIYPMETNKGWKMGEVINYCTLTYPTAYTTTFFVAMNKDKWNSLPPEIQKTIRDINTKWADKHGRAWDESDVEGLEFIKQKGSEVISLDEQESKRWEQVAQPIITDYQKELDKKRLPGKKVIETIQKSLANK